MLVPLEEDPRGVQYYISCHQTLWRRSIHNCCYAHGTFPGLLLRSWCVPVTLSLLCPTTVLILYCYYCTSTSQVVLDRSQSVVDRGGFSRFCSLPTCVSFFFSPSLRRTWTRQLYTEHIVIVSWSQSLVFSAIFIYRAIFQYTSIYFVFAMGSSSFFVIGAGFYLLVLQVTIEQQSVEWRPHVVHRAPGACIFFRVQVAQLCCDDYYCICYGHRVTIHFFLC